MHQDGQHRGTLGTSMEQAETWRHQHMKKGGVAGSPADPTVTQSEQGGGWSETSGWVTQVEFLQARHRQEKCCGLFK